MENHSPAWHRDRDRCCRQGRECWKDIRRRQLQSKAVLPFDRTQHIPPVTLKIAQRGRHFPSAQVPCPQPASYLLTLGLNLIYLPLLLSSCPMPASASSYRLKTLIPIQASAAAGAVEAQKGSTVLQRAGREDAEGQTSRSLPILYQHPPSPHHTAFPPGSLPRSHSSQHHQHTRLTSTHSSLGLTAGIEDTSLDFEIVLCEMLPRMTCRVAFSQHFHSVQQFGLKASRFGKTKGCTVMLAEQRGKFPFSWTWWFSFLSL